MKEKTQIKKKLDTLVSDYANGNKSEFSRRLGMSRQQFNAWYSKSSLDYKRIHVAFPEIPLELLMNDEETKTNTMDKKSKVRNQLNILVATFGHGKKTELARLLGITKQSLNTWYINDYIDVKKVFNTCPGISANWLLTGEGELFQTEKSEKYQKIAFVSSEEELKKDFQNPKHFCLIDKLMEVNVDFLIKMPNDSLDKEISPGAILGCNIVKFEDLNENCLCILVTTVGTFFIKYLGGQKFSTLKKQNEENIVFEIPLKNILRCAVIKNFTAFTL